uniref:Uncharacterized protein n=1 Tax=viral metagenome TaxID=1070528 RepID=A0A6C0CS77_9ZZZZ
MAQYCTLQEAYNIPSFSRKKKNCMPLDPNASADPYNPFTEQRGREQAKVIKESFQNTNTQDAMGENEKVTYKGLKQDYDFYCKDYNICALEGFTADEKPSGKMFNQKVTSMSKDKCPPSEALAYEYPISDGDKAKFQAALKVALNQMEYPSVSSENLNAAQGIPRKGDISKVKGYVDEELESYMKVHEMKAAPKIQPITEQTPPTELPGFDTKPGKLAPFSNDVQPQHGKTYLPRNFTQTNAIWMDLLLFVASGILLIFLLEQLYKIALMSGMKKTIQAMDTLIRLQQKSH